MTQTQLISHIKKISTVIRYYILLATTQAQSGHPTSSLSAVEVMTTLFFGGFLSFDLENPQKPDNDRVLFSKGHAAPLLYSLYAATGKISEKELKKLRMFSSPLEGHPMPPFTYTEAATGSLGQGLSIGTGIALHAQHFTSHPFTTYVLLGDGEMAEGSNWEAIQLASHYNLHSLVGIIDVNRLGQQSETMIGHKVEKLHQQISSFGWNVLVVDGHNIQQIIQAFQSIKNSASNQPHMIVAKTIKGKGVSLWENKNNWHSKQLSVEQFQQAITELGDIDTSLTAKIAKPNSKLHLEEKKQHPKKKTQINQTPFFDTKQKKTIFPQTDFTKEKKVATKKAFGLALAACGQKHTDLIVLDADVSNSTHTDIFQKEFPERFFQVFIAEQNMIGIATGFATRGHHVCACTFAAFLTRAYDQIRMAQYSDINLFICGSYAGTSIGMDGASQMGLEDIAMMRAILGSTVLYPSDAISTFALTKQALSQPGIVYLRTTREPTPTIYSQEKSFTIGGSHTLHSSTKDIVTVIAAGITVHQTLEAYQQLIKQNISIRVIDLYSIKPVDTDTILRACQNTQAIITVEDHFAQGGIADAVRTTVSTLPLEKHIPVHSLAVTRTPHSGKPQELLHYEGIDATAIVKTVHKIIN